MLVQNVTGIALDAVLTRLLPAGLVPASNIATGTCVLVATADWGPENKATAVGNLNDYVSKFGTYAKSGANETTGYAQAWGYFTGGKKRRIAGGGRDLRMIRIVGASKAKASSVIIDNAQIPDTIGTVQAKYYGKAGDGIQRKIEDGDGRLAVPAVPALAASDAGGTLDTGMVFVAVTAVNNRGETIASTEASAEVTGPTGSVSVPLPAIPGATGYHVYAGSASGALKRATTTPATGASYVLTELPGGAEAEPPTSNTAVSTFHLSVIPFDARPPEVFKNLTAATAAAAINGKSQFIVWNAGQSMLIPLPGTAYLAGGDSGLNVMDADYVGAPGAAPTGFELAKTVSDANFVISGKLSPAIKTKMKEVETALYAQAIVGADDPSKTPDDVLAEPTFDDWGVIYAHGYQDWMNPISDVVQSIFPAGSIAGALCNGPYWANLSQCKLEGYLGPTTPLSEVDAERLAKRGIIPITEGSVCRKGLNTSTDESINQIEDFRIPVFLAKSADKTIQPLIAEPQVYIEETGESPFFDDITEALENLIRQQPREAIQRAYVDARFDDSLASQNKVRVAVVARQTGKANQIVLDLTVGRTALAVVPEGVNLITGS
jgi:hypothetical protein